MLHGPFMTTSRLLNDADRIHAHIDCHAIAHNLAQMKERLNGAATRFWATAKADAYGHGLARVLPGLAAADGISVQTLDEAHACRRSGWHGPILVHAGLRCANDTQALTLPGLQLIVSHAAQLDWLARTQPSAPPALWLRYVGDTHLGGFSDTDYSRIYARALALNGQGHASGIGHLNHYARAEEAGGTTDADTCFRRAIAGLSGPVSCCNSAALLLHPAQAAATDWVRPGITLYGVSPLPDVTGPDLGLRPAMTLSARLLAVQHLPAGASLGYGGAFVAQADTRIGLVACGYADGYPRHAGTGTPVKLESGRITRMLGRPSMDLLTIDLNGHADARPGSVVTLWGGGLPVERVAAAASTIAAELLTCLTARVPFSPTP